jgi:hypothetical protein
MPNSEARNDMEQGNSLEIFRDLAVRTISHTLRVGARRMRSLGRPSTTIFVHQS